MVSRWQLNITPSRGTSEESVNQPASTRTSEFSCPLTSRQVSVTFGIGSAPANQIAENGIGRG